jgi:hypothetical protein
LTQVARWIVWPAVLAIVAVTLCPIKFRPMVLPADLERSLAFALLGGLLSVAYPKHRIICLLLGIGCAALLEAAQYLVQGRHGHLHDFVIKAVGMVAGSLLGAFILHLWPSQPLDS